MYAYTFKHIDSMADSIEVIAWFQTCLKQLSALASFKKNQEGWWKNEKQIDKKLKSTLGEANISTEKHSFWLL